MIKFNMLKKFLVTNFGIQLVPCPTDYQGVFEWDITYKTHVRDCLHYLHIANIDSVTIVRQ